MPVHAQLNLNCFFFALKLKMNRERGTRAAAAANFMATSFVDNNHPYRHLHLHQSIMNELSCHSDGYYGTARVRSLPTAMFDSLNGRICLCSLFTSWLALSISRRR